MKIRNKITYKFTISTVVIFIVCSFIIYFFVEKRREINFFKYIDKEMSISIIDIYQFKKNNLSYSEMISGNSLLPYEVLEILIYDSDINLVYKNTKNNLNYISENSKAISEAIQNSSNFINIDNYQVVIKKIINQGQVSYVVAIAYDKYGIKLTNDLLFTLIFLCLTVAIILFLACYFISKRALLPIENITNHLELISDKDFGERLEINNNDDELTDLVVAIDYMLDKLSKSFHDQKMFISNVSHELRTPMAAFVAELELALLKDRTVEEYKQTIVCALDDAEKMEKLSEGLLNLAKANYDPQLISRANIRLDELLLDARALIIKANPDYKVEIYFNQEIDDDRVITVYGNDYLLKIAFQNLIDNNCKYSDNNTSIISISFFDGNAIISFSDIGAGMTPEELNNIFTPFFRGNNREKAIGYGIGMTLVKKIVDLHKGNITVSSQKGEGSMFIIELNHI